MKAPPSLLQLSTSTMHAMKKIERTHEENQERAYIAASRRSDRSIEARVESARRASDIHKQRTGKSLRVRQEDVVNEEMYEEEDDDMPMPYRHLTAHLQTSSKDFGARLAAYLANQVAVRAALDAAISKAYVSGEPLYPGWNPSNSPFPPPRSSSDAIAPLSTGLPANATQLLHGGEGFDYRSFNLAALDAGLAYQTPAGEYEPENKPGMADRPSMFGAEVEYERGLEPGGDTWGPETDAWDSWITDWEGEVEA